MNEKVWGHDPRPSWLWIGTTIGSHFFGDSDDTWDYDPQMEVLWKESQRLRRLVPGMPWLFIDGQPMTEALVQDLLGLRISTVFSHIRDHGSCGYTNPHTGQYYAFEIRLDNLREAEKFVVETRARKKEEFNRLRREQRAATPKPGEVYKTAIHSKQFSFDSVLPAVINKKVDTDRPKVRRDFGLSRRLEDLKKELVFTDRPPQAPGAKYPRVYVNGHRYKPLEAMRRIGWRPDTRLFAALLQIGDFTTKDGHRVTYRLETDSDLKDQRNTAQKKTITEKLPYFSQEWELGVTPHMKWLYTFNGEIMRSKEIAKRVGLHIGSLNRLMRIGPLVARDGTWIVSRRPPIHVERPPVMRVYAVDAVIRVYAKGHERPVFRSTNKARVQALYDEIMSGDWKQHPKVKEVLDRFL